jgi:hypothetical protein
MRLIIISILFFNSLFNLYGQKDFAKIELVNGIIENIQAFPVGDSIFFSYLTKQFKGDFIKAGWIYPNGTIDGFDFNEIRGKNLLEISRRSNDHFFYYSGPKKNLVKILKWEMITNAKTVIDDKIDLGGAFLTSFINNGVITFISFNNDSDELIFLKVSGTEVIEKKTVPVLKFYSSFLKKSSFVEAFEKGIQNNSATGAARVKIIDDRTSFLFIIDQPFDPEFANRVCRSSVIRVDKQSFQSQQFTINDFSKDQFSSFAFDSSFFRVSVSKKKMMVSIFDLKTRQLKKSESFVVDSSENFKAYYRRGSTHKIAEESSYHLIELSAGTPAILVTSVNDSNIIRVGTFYNEGGMIGPAGANPVTALAVMVVGTAIRQMIEKPGVSRYFYLKENDNHTNFELSTDNINQRIDDYELGFKKDHEIKSKIYVPVRNGFVGLYYVKEEKSVTVVKYDAVIR